MMRLQYINGYGFSLVTKQYPVIFLVMDEINLFLGQANNPSLYANGTAQLKLSTGL